MTRSLIAVAALLLATNVVPGQVPEKKTAPKTPSAKTAAQTKVPASTKAQSAPAKSAAGAQKGGAGASKTGAAAQKGLPTPAQDTSGPPPTIYREAFAYTPGGRRDPFNSLLTTEELRPTLSDLKVTGILYDPSGRRSQATLRDINTNKQYSNVTTGTTLGRMRVAAIRPHVIIFTIDEFGTTRQDSLVLGDTTKARVK